MDATGLDPTAVRGRSEDSLALMQQQTVIGRTPLRPAFPRAGKALAGSLIWQVHRQLGQQ